MELVNNVSNTGERKYPALNEGARAIVFIHPRMEVLSLPNLNISLLYGALYSVLSISIVNSVTTVIRNYT